LETPARDASLRCDRPRWVRNAFNLRPILSIAEFCVELLTLINEFDLHYNEFKGLFSTV